MNLRATFFAAGLALAVAFGSGSAHAQTCDDVAQSLNQVAVVDFNRQCAGQRYVSQLDRCAAINNQQRSLAQRLLASGCSEELNSWARIILRNAAIADRNHALLRSRGGGGYGSSGYPVRPDMPHKPNCYGYGVGC